MVMSVALCLEMWRRLGTTRLRGLLSAPGSPLSLMYVFPHAPTPTTFTRHLSSVFAAESFRRAGTMFTIPPIPKRLPAPGEPGMGYRPEVPGWYPATEVFTDEYGCGGARGGLLVGLACHCVG